MYNDPVYPDLFSLGMHFQTRMIDFYFNSYKKDMTYLQCRVFDHICNNDGISAQEIAVFFGLSKQHVSLILEKLEASGLVSRRKSKKDRRSSEILLTEAGRSYYADHLKLAYEHYVEMTKGLSADEQALFSQNVTTLNALFKKI